MSTKPPGHIDFSQGLESVSGAHGDDLPIKKTHADLPPTGQMAHSDLDSVMVKTRGIDEMLLRELNPEIKDKMSMAPIRYHALLAKAAATMFKAGSEKNDPELIASAQLIFEELELLRTMAAQRNRNGGA